MGLARTMQAPPWGPMGLLTSEPSMKRIGPNANLNRPATTRDFRHLVGLCQQQHAKAKQAEVEFSDTRNPT
jgi:hypothetical protein